MNINEIYDEIGRLLWSIMPNGASKIIYDCMIYSSFEQGGAYWLDRDFNEKYFDEPYLEVYEKISVLIRDLRKQSFFKGNYPNHFRFSLSEKGRFDIKFAYIEEEDSWSNLYLRGISDLKEEELDEYYIPKEIWLDRVARKDEIYQIKKDIESKCKKY
ncbi:Uncharacterised protein [Pasteurella multocida]|nr:Uncharacterised protein [Pasteurella multocida]